MPWEFTAVCIRWSLSYFQSLFCLTFQGAHLNAHYILPFKAQTHTLPLSCVTRIVKSGASVLSCLLRSGVGNGRCHIQGGAGHIWKAADKLSPRNPPQTDNSNLITKLSKKHTQRSSYILGKQILPSEKHINQYFFFGLVYKVPDY